MGYLSRLLGLENESKITSTSDTDIIDGKSSLVHTSTTMSVREFYKRSTGKSPAGLNHNGIPLDISNIEKGSRDLLLLSAAEKTLELHPDKVTMAVRSINQDILDRLPQKILEQEQFKEEQVGTMYRHLKSIGVSSSQTEESQYPGVDSKGKPIILNRRVTTYKQFDPASPITAKVQPYHIRAEPVHAEEIHEVNLNFETDGGRSSLSAYSSFEVSSSGLDVSGGGITISYGEK